MKGMKETTERGDSTMGWADIASAEGHFVRVDADAASAGDIPTRYTSATKWRLNGGILKRKENMGNMC